MNAFDSNGDGNFDAWDTTGDGNVDAIDSSGDGQLDSFDTTVRPYLAIHTEIPSHYTTLHCTGNDACKIGDVIADRETASSTQKTSLAMAMLMQLTRTEMGFWTVQGKRYRWN